MKNQNTKQIRLTGVRFVLAFSIVLGSFLFFGAGKAWAATYYVSKTGSNTAPYDTAAKGATTIKTVVDAIKALGDGGGHTIIIGAGTFNSVNDYFLLNDADCSNLIIQGAGRDNTIIAPDAAANVHVVSFGAGPTSNSTWSDMTLQVEAATKQAIYGTFGGNYNRVNLVAGVGHQNKLVYLLGGTTNMTSILMRPKYQTSGNMFLTASTAALNLYNSIVEYQPGIMYSTEDMTIQINGTGGTKIYNCTILGCPLGGIRINNATGADIDNCIIQAGLMSHTSYCVTRQAGTVTVDGSLLLSSPWAVDAFLGGTITDGATKANIKTNVDPNFEAFPRVGFVIPMIDDTAGLTSGYVTDVETVLATGGWKGTWAVTTSDLGAGSYGEVRSLLQRGIIEIAAHGRTHTPQSYTHALHFTQTGGSNCTYAFDGSTITMDCDGSSYDQTVDVTAAANDTLGEVIANYNGVKGWTIAKSTTGGQTASNIQNGVLCSGLATKGVTAAGSEDIDFNVSGYSVGQFKNEITDPKAFMADTIINGGGNIIDPQTGAAYICRGSVAPFAAGTAVSKQAVKDAGYLYYRYNTDTTWETNTGQLRDIDIYVLGINPNYVWLGDGTETNVRKNARAIGIAAAQSGMLIGILGHNTSQISIAQWGWMLDEISKIPNVTITSMQSAVDMIQTSGSWHDDGDGTWSRTFEYGDYGIQSSSPAIDTATDVSLTTDYAGNPIYGLPDIGGYEYQPPHTIGTTEVDIGAGARIYGDGQFRDLNTTSGDTANLSITPQSGSFPAYGATEVRPAWLDLAINTWTNSGTHHKNWTESNAVAGLTNTLHTVGDLEADKYYNVTIDDAISDLEGDDCETVGSNFVCQADDIDGKISFTYTGTYFDHTFDVEAGDNIPPTTTASPEGGLYNSAKNVTLICTDNGGGSGCAATYYSTDGDPTADPDHLYSGAIDIASTTTLKFFSVDANGNQEDIQTETYTIDTIPPNTTIDTHPTSPTNSTSATFTFSATETATFQCELDGGGLSDCTSPKNYLGLSENSHTLNVKAIDEAGNPDASPASFTWTIDTTAPTVSDVTSTTADGSYKSGETINVRVTFDENAVITGTPHVKLQTANGNKYATYSGGTGTQNIDFTYTIQAGDTTSDLDYVDTISLELNGGTLKDAAGNNATLTLPAPGADHSLGGNKALILDTETPVLSNGQPGGTLDVETVDANLSLTTSETAACKYSTTSGTAYDLMADTFTDTNSTAHETNISGLETGTTYAYYVKCADLADNQSDDYTISFSIAPEEDRISLNSIKVKISRQTKKFKNKIYSLRKELKLRGNDINLSNGTVEIYKNGNLWKTVLADAAGEWSKTLKFKKDFSGWIKVRQFDQYGTLLGSKNVRVKIDTEDPEFVSFPSFGQYIARGEQINFKASDNEKVKKYKINLAGYIKHTQTASYTIPEYITPGLHVLRIKAYDKAGNSVSGKIYIRVR